MRVASSNRSRAKRGSQRYGAAVWSGDIPATWESLRQQVQERDALLARMNEKLGHLSADHPHEDMSDYEEELHRYRVELERDRHEMNEQMAQLQQRQL